MTASLWLPILVKAIATALIVVSASAVAEAVGPFWGALIASLPVSAGPAYVFLSIEHGENFVAASALSSLAANAATGLLLTSYSILARRSSSWQSLGVAVLVWLAGGLAAQRIDWTPLTALSVNLAVYGAGSVLLTAAADGELDLARPARRRWFDLTVRAASVAFFVSLIVAVSSILGPDATGIAAVFPVSLISLIAIVRLRTGRLASAILAANALWAMAGFGVALLALHLAIQPWGTTAALLTAGSISVLWSGALLLLRARPRAG